MERDTLSLAAAVDMVEEEFHRACFNYPTWPTDPLHALAMVGAKFGELQRAAVQRIYEPRKAVPNAVRTEAAQCAALALRFLVSLPAYRYEGGEQHEQGEYD